MWKSPTPTRRWISRLVLFPPIVHDALLGQSLKMRIIRIFMFILFSTIFIVGTFSYFFLSRTINNEVTSYSEIIVSQVSKNLQSNFAGLDSIINSVYYYEILQDAISPNQDTTPYQQIVTAKKVVEVLRNILYLRKDIEKVTLYSIGNHYSYTLSKTNDYQFQEDLVFQKAGWYEGIIEYDGQILIMVTEDEERGKSFSAFKTLKGNDLVTPIGVIRMDLNMQEISDICSEVKLVNDGRVVIMDGDGTVVLDTSNDYGDVEEYDQPLFTDLLKRSIWIQGQSYYVNYFELGLPNWKIAYLSPYRTIYRSLYTVRNITVLIGILLLGLTAMMTIKFVKRFTSPIEQLTQHLKKIENGDLIPFQHPYARHDEVGELIAGINSMVGKLDRLVLAEYKSQLLAKDAQLNAMIAQINPHFLYNIMENISGIGYSRGIPELSVITENLVDMLRYSINSSSLVGSVKDEIEQIQKYIIIQNARFNNGIHLEVSLPECILEQKVLKFVLQPLVENSVLHGLLANEYCGCIRIEAQLLPDRIIISVQDDGIGISPDEIDALNKPSTQYLAPKEGRHHVGIHNVNTRLKLYYGAEFGLTYSSEKGKGTTVWLQLPLLWEGETQECIR